MRKRPRINNKDRMAGAEEVKDDLAFTKNLCSENARFIDSTTQRLLLDLWHDKHYIIRNQHGDENGPREGIDPDFIKKIVLCGLKHLLLYGSSVTDFAFLNREGKKTMRVVLQDFSDEEATLNVVIQVHFIDFFRYEVTVITAQRINGFKLMDGQYILEMRSEYDSVLKRLLRGNIVVIDSCQT